jgi:hypothetical protein
MLIIDRPGCLNTPLPSHFPAVTPCPGIFAAVFGGVCRLFRRHSHPGIPCFARAQRRPVDKVFALLGLSSDYRTWEPDFFKSKAEIYIQIATSFDRYPNNHIKNVHYESVMSDHNDKTLPPWVPDWSEPPTRINLGQTRSNSNGWFFTAGRDQRAEGLEPEFPVEGNTLFVKGVILQTITEVGRDSDPATQDAPNLSHLLAVLADITFFQRSNYRYPTGEHINRDYVHHSRSRSTRKLWGRYFLLGRHPFSRSSFRARTVPS